MLLLLLMMIGDDSYCGELGEPIAEKDHSCP